MISKQPRENDIKPEEENQNNLNRTSENSTAVNEGVIVSKSSLNNTEKAKLNLVIFNQVPIVENQAFNALLNQLSDLNDFEHTRNQSVMFDKIFITPQLRKLWISKLLKTSKPQLHSQRIAFINFTQYHIPKPIYMSVIRDPVQQVIDWHYHVRSKEYQEKLKANAGNKSLEENSKEFLEMDLDSCVRLKKSYCTFPQNSIADVSHNHIRQMLYFCGQNKKRCLPFNSKSALERAKETVEKEYAVVGAWESMNITLTVLESYVPKYFRNAKDVFFLEDHAAKITVDDTKRPIKKKTLAILRQNLTREIEFYDFCKQRLYLQYAALHEAYKEDDEYDLTSQFYEDKEN